MLSPIEKEINALKKERNAIVLAHYYEDGAIQDIADFVGDSYALAQFGKDSKAEVVLMAGVVFMAEGIKLLSPEKTVLVPDLHASCSLVHSSPTAEFKKWRESFKDAICVTYINSSAEVKALSDVICTSSNAERILASIPKDKKILFAPDKHLGGFLKKKTGRDMELWQGSCEVHVLFNARKLYELRSEHPDAIVLAHPECDESVLNYSDVVGSTSRLLQEVSENPSKKFIVATEDGIFHQMRKSRPDAEILQAPTDEGCVCNQCPYMKLNTLGKVRNALRDLSPVVNVDPQLQVRAALPLQRMLDISKGENVVW
ncbi:MAG: quinolinate synthase NadA [Bdellovibrionales bacterium]|nr:quinolinate synthase NadA [Bdellovibrionales bacterium]